MVWMDVRVKRIGDIHTSWQNEIQHANSMDVAELAALKYSFAAAVAV
jgi:hypothetical protein